MSQIDRIVNVSITRETQQIDIASFDIPLLLVSIDVGALTDWVDERVRTYTSLEALKDDFSTSHEVYTMATKLLSGDVRPATFKVGKVITDLGPQTITGVVEGSSSDVPIAYAVTQQPVSGTAAVDPATGEWTYVSVQGFEGTASFEITATDDEAVPEVIPVNVEIVAHEDYSTALHECIDADGTFYAIMADTHDEDVVKDLAATVQAMRRVYFTSTDDTDVPRNVDSDIGTYLLEHGYFRTILMYSPVADTEYPECSWVGSQIVEIPGSNTWEYKRLPGVSISRLTDSEINNLEDKGVNYYITVKGAPITRRGVSADKSWIDEINKDSLLAA